MIQSVMNRMAPHQLHRHVAGKTSLIPLPQTSHGRGLLSSSRTPYARRSLRFVLRRV